MRLIQTLLIGGAACAVIAGAAAAAEAVRNHSMEVALPGGGTARIEYSGDVAPKVTFNQTPAWRIGFWPSAFGADPFAAFDQMQAEMERETRAMLQQVEQLQSRALDSANPVTMADFGGPAGASGYSYDSTFSSNGACVRETQITRNAGDAAPKVVTHTSGSCADGAAPDARTPDARTPAAQPPASAARVIPAKALVPAKPAVQPAARD
jgi:hypothetical protein